MGEDLEQFRWTCRRALSWHGNRSAPEMLSEVPTDLGVDRYGEGGAVERIERETCELLGKPAAVFMPSGTMAQQIALRIHSDRNGSRSIGMHPTAHLELHEERGYEQLHDLSGVIVGHERALITMDDLRALDQPIAAFLFELPQREIGGQLPSWDDLLEQTEFLRARGIALHLDGARLWECVPFYGKTLAEIAGLFDSVYVSFYKGIGGLGGCCLAGDEGLVADARVWRRRHGGTLFALWPYAASAVTALRARLPRMQSYHEHAVAIADAVRGIEGVRIVPDPPQTTMMHLWLRTSEEHVLETARAFAEKESLWTWAGSAPTDDPAFRAVELTVGDATMGFAPSEVAEIVARFVT